MHEAWHLLKLNPETATPKDVKAAYARLLKSHRPDRDPEGFRRVREAYEQAMARFADAPPDRRSVRPEPLTPEPLTPEPPPYVVPSLPLPSQADQPEGEAWKLARARLAKALATGETPVIQHAFEAFVRQSRIDRMPMRQEAAALLAVLGSEAAALGKFVSPAWLVRCLEHGLPEIPRQVVDNWVTSENTPSLLALGEELAESIRHVESDDSLEVIAVLVRATVFWDVHLACCILDRVEPLMPPSGVKFLQDRTDPELALGRMFSTVPQQHRRFWEKLVHRDKTPVDWKSREVKEALAWLRENRGASWDGYEVVRPLLPPREWSRFEKAAARSLSSEWVDWKGILTPWMGRIMVLLILLVVRGCTLSV